MTVTSTVQTSSSGTTYLTSTVSGIDTQALITAAVNAKLVPKTRLTDQITTNTNTIAAYQDLQSKIASVQADMNQLKASTSTIASSTATNALTAKAVTYATSSTTPAASILTATVDSTALTGSHKIIVSKLAEAESVTSDEQTSSTATLNYSGTFDIGQTGNTAQTITVTPSSTLQSIADSINASTNLSGVQADILQAADGKYKLVISGSSTAQPISVTNVTGDDVLTNIGVTNTSGNGGGFKNISQAAQQAQISVDGTTIYSNSNKITNVLNGLSLTLTNADPATTITVNVGNNVAGVTSVIQDFVTTYNTLHDALAEYQSVSSSGTVASDAYLYNDPIGNSLRTDISQALTSLFGAGSNYTSLGALGITINSNNDLSLDSTVLNTALTNNFSDVTNFFASNATTGTTGFADTFYNIFETYGDTTSGTMATAITNLQTLDTNLQSQADDIQSSADDYQQTLITKYANLETQIQTANILKEQVDAILKGSTSSSN